ncbi:MAG TPA: TetR/AcrR family transcriptional regulator [Acidimicrobiales bacterium]|nr:TetR/AcrR family transcriptional regulator [Acidimicrobiales bacterium]
MIDEKGVATNVAWLRQVPQQRRSLARVEALLDTAELVFEEVGYDAATTNLIAERADIPVGTLYRWFPDKAALADGLVSRYVERIAGAYEYLVTAEPPPTEILRDVTHELAQVVFDSPAMAAIIGAATLPSAPDAPGVRLRSTAQEAIRLLIQLRAPTIAEADLERMSDVLTTVAFGVLGRAGRLEGTARLAMVDELADLVISWLAARLPPPDDPVWEAANPLVVPVAPTRNRVPGRRHGLGGRDA